jgi:dethiobiotin synthetase
MRQAFFVTGTDTSVGKTLVSAALLHAANNAGLKAYGLKPIAAGCHSTEGGWRNDDALMLARYANIALEYEQINPVALQAPISPHLSAERESRRVSVDRLVGYCRGAMLESCDLCLVEGAGGWRVPINSGETMADLAKALKLPVVLVVGIRLGCLNHALLSAEAIMRDGLHIAGWVANVVDANTMAIDENIATLERKFPFPLLAHIPFMNKVSAERVSELFDISKLIEKRID